MYAILLHTLYLSVSTGVPGCVAPEIHGTRDLETLQDPEVPPAAPHVHGISDTNTLGITREYHYAVHVEHMYVCSICIVYSILLHTLYLVEGSREYAYSASLLFSRS